MSSILILLVGGIYLIVGLDLCVRQKQLGMGLAFLAYSVSNVGLFLASRGL